uniref:hypothetical protein n=1 Tax=Bakuella subtropica TaxID=1295181 RepID=UPI0023F48283|nr:hypothetical protein P4D19_mgp11 [Bakuella subtropica]WDY80890.1 hypothetical protein BKSUB_49 [Bakuella subtropica]
MYIEYINQDPDKVNPVNAEKLTERLEWQGTVSDWCALIVLAILFLLYGTAFILNLPYWDYFQPAFHPKLVKPVWTIAFRGFIAADQIFTSSFLPLNHSFFWDNLLQTIVAVCPSL